MTANLDNFAAEMTLRGGTDSTERLARANCVGRHDRVTGESVSPRHRAPQRNVSVIILSRGVDLVRERCDSANGPTVRVCYPLPREANAVGGDDETGLLAIDVTYRAAAS